MSYSTAKPFKITLNRETRQMVIVWADGHVSQYPLDGLREACPCAVCRGGHDKMGPDFDPNLIELKPARSYEARDMQIVGNYALQFTWSDAHAAGLYSWDYLRRICPCPQCQADRQASQRP
jgi:prepilin-type processing-associated H-X9-DG protein